MLISDVTALEKEGGLEKGHKVTECGGGLGRNFLILFLNIISTILIYKSLLNVIFKSYSIIQVVNF